MRRIVVIILAVALVMGAVGLIEALPSNAATTSVNVAPSAAVTASSQNTSTGQLATKAVDGSALGYPADSTKEWATVGGTTGSWLKLTWSVPQTVTSVVLNDRPNSNDQITAATIVFSDGTSVAAGSLPNDGTAKTVTFSAKATTSVQIQVTGVSGTTHNVGLAEVQVIATTSTGGNLAANATVSVSSQNSTTAQLGTKAVDGVVDGYPGDFTKEWATLNGKAGSWIKLTWAAPQTISGVVLHDRVSSIENITGARVTLSDGSTFTTGALPNNGAGLAINFSSRAVTSVQVDVTGVSASSVNIGLAEIEVVAGTTVTTSSTTTTARPTTTTTQATTTTTRPPSTTTTTAASGNVYNGTGTDLQAMVNNTPSGYTLVVPSGTYTLRIPANNGAGLTLKSNTNYDFTRATINLAANSYGNYSMIKLWNLSNVTLKLGTVNGDRDTHTGTSGEWGMLIDIRASSNIKVVGGRVNKAWGDGVYIGYVGSTMSSNIEVAGTIIKDCGRNDLSVTGCNGANIHDGYSFSANRTDPQGGVGLEPNAGGSYCKNVIVQNWWSDSNGNMGFYMNGAAGSITGCKFINCQAYRQVRGLYMINCSGNTIQNCKAIGNTNYNIKDYGGNTLSGNITSGSVPAKPNP